MQGLAYDANALDEVFQNKLIQDSDRDPDQFFNVVMIADLSIASTMLRERMEEIWTRQLLFEREKEKLFQPKILDLGQLVGYDVEKSYSTRSVPSEFTEFGDSDYESMVRLILKETKQTAIVLFGAIARTHRKWFEADRPGRRGFRAAALARN